MQVQEKYQRNILIEQSQNTKTFSEINFLIFLLLMDPACLRLQNEPISYKCNLKKPSMQTNSQ
jgi:hypothetical protein